MTDIYMPHIQKTIDMMHALDNGGSIDADALADALHARFGVTVADYGYHDLDATDGRIAQLRADHAIVIERGEWDFVNLPIGGVRGILVSHHKDEYLWSLGLEDGNVLY